MYRVKIEALDGKVITERTGKVSCIANTQTLPKNGAYHLFFYHEEDCESPGCAIDINGLEILDKEYKFYDYHDRPFKMTIIEEMKNEKNN